MAITATLRRRLKEYLENHAGGVSPNFGSVGADALNVTDATKYDDTNDSMTADPETATESGYIEIEVDGTTKQVPFYDP